MNIKTPTLDRRMLLRGASGLAALGLAGCGFSGDSDSGSASKTSGSAPGGGGPSGTITYSPAASMDSLDPHYVNNAMIVVPAGLLEGLVFANDDSTDVIPAAAESWEMSEDGKVYTFKMREGAKWSNGDPVTAKDAEWSFKRLLSPTGAGSGGTKGASSYLPGLAIAGAEDFLAGVTDDWESVGVKALDDSQLEITLDSPNSDFLLLMSHYSMVLVHPPSVEADATGWMQPENWVGNGAYVPTTWEPTTQLQMQANESYWDYENLGVANIDVRFGIDQTAQLASFSAGEIDMMVGDTTIIDQRSDLEKFREAVYGYTSFYLQFMWGGHEAARDRKVRQAISRAIDREAIAGLSSVHEAGVSLVPGNVVEGWDKSMATPFDVDASRALVAEAGLDKMPKLRVQSAFETPILEMLASQWESAFGNEAVIDILEAGVHAESRFKPYPDEDTISFYYGSFSGVPTYGNWINNIFGPDHVLRFSLTTEDSLEHASIQADESLSGPERAMAVNKFLREHADPDAVKFADLAVDARSTLDDAERLKRFNEAASLRDEMAYTIPLIWGGRAFLVAERVEGFIPRPSPEIIYYKNLRVTD